MDGTGRAGCAGEAAVPDSGEIFSMSVQNGTLLALKRKGKKLPVSTIMILPVRRPRAGADRAFSQDPGRRGFYREMRELREGANVVKKP
jgi:hypothetical protein